MLPDRSRPDARPVDARANSDVDPAEDLADAHHAINYFSIWINNADTKAGLLSAALAVVVAGSAQQAHAIGDVARPNGPAEVAAIVALCLLGVALAVGVMSLAMVVTPRMYSPKTLTRFAFPTVASDSWRGNPVSREQAASEAWAQAHVLARIARGKFAILRVASVAVFAAVGLVTAWVVATSLVQ